MYYSGHNQGGIEQNVTRALELWSKATRLGHANAALARALVHFSLTIVHYDEVHKKNVVSCSYVCIL